MFVGCASTDDMVERSLTNCDSAYQTGRSAIQRSFDEALKCCNKLLAAGDTAGYAACTAAVATARAEALGNLDGAHTACIGANAAALGAAIDSIKEIVETATKAACDLGTVLNVTQSINGEVANVSEPLNRPEAIRIELSGRALGIHQLPDGANTNSRYTATLSGSVTFEMGPMPIAMPAKVHLTMSIPQNQHEHGIVHTMRLEVAGGGVFESPESFQGSVYRNNEGRRVMNVVLVDASSSANGDDIRVGIALELPFTISGNRIRISTGGQMVATEQIAPVAPNAIADWRRDFTVDMTDYAFFMESFASGLCDLNGDGETDELDIEFFEERFWAEFEG